MALTPIRSTAATLPRRVPAAAATRVQPASVQASAAPARVTQQSDGFFHQLGQIPGPTIALAGSALMGLAFGLSPIIGPLALGVGVAAGAATFFGGAGMWLYNKFKHH